MLGLFFILVMIAVIVSIHMLNKRDERIDDENRQKRWEKYIITTYNTFLKEHNLALPEHKIIVRYAIDYNDIYIWKDNEKIFLYSSLEYLISHRFLFANSYEMNDFIKYNKLKLFFKQINVASIIYYKVEGDVITSTYTTGGTVKGGGSSLTGAIVGGVLAGDVGAIIGSREKIEVEPVSTHTEHDDQRVVNVYISEGDTVKIQQYPYKLYGAFQKLMPEKSYDYIALHQTTQPKEKSSADRLQELQNLKDSGLITEDEYQDKRAVIVSEI